MNTIPVWEIKTGKIGDLSTEPTQIFFPDTPKKIPRVPPLMPNITIPYKTPLGSARNFSRWHIKVRQIWLLIDGERSLADIQRLLPSNSQEFVHDAVKEFRALGLVAIVYDLGEVTDVKA